MNSIFQSIKRSVVTLALIFVASCSGSGDTTPTGTVTFWADVTTSNQFGAANCINMRLILDGVDIGELKPRVPIPTKCGDFSDPLAITRAIPEGLHSIAVTSSTTVCNWTTSSLKITANTCSYLQFLISSTP